MSSPNANNPPPLDLSGWQKLPGILLAVGAVLSVIGLVKSPAEFGYSWLMAFMFYLTHRPGRLVPGDDPSSD